MPRFISLYHPFIPLSIELCFFIKILQKKTEIGNFFAFLGLIPPSAAQGLVKGCFLL